MTDRELMQMALDNLRWINDEQAIMSYATVKDLRDRLAQPVHAIDISQERVDETAKDRHEWVGLTDEDVAEAYNRDEFWWMQMRDISHEDLKEFVAAIEAKLKEKNT